jgi:hypothetical protein
MSTETAAPTTADTVTQTANELRQTMGAVRVSFSWLGTQRKLSDAQTKQAADTFHAETDLVTASKKLIDTKNPTYRVLTALKSQVSGYWRSMTLPYPQEGVRLIKQSDVEAFEVKMREFKEQLAAAAANLQLEYETLKEAARQKLGDLFNAADYPSTLEGVFDIKWEYPAVEAPNYLMTFNPDLYEQEQRRVQERFETAVLMTEQAFAERLQELVSHLIERLADEPDGTKKTFRSSAVENFKEFYENFRRMNVRSNDQLENLIKQANDLVAGVEVKELRNNDEVRRNLSQQMATVQSSLDNLITNAPRRRVMPMG